jgi:PleD family two-component response regulator
VVGEHVRKAVEEQCAPVTVSVGAAAASMVSEDGTGWRNPREVVVEAIEKADEALYEAKSAGRNRVILSSK